MADSNTGRLGALLTASNTISLIVPYPAIVDISKLFKEIKVALE